MRAWRFKVAERTLAPFADDPSQVEVVLRIDWDDQETQAYVQHHQVTGWAAMLGAFVAVSGSRLDGYATVPTFINEAADVAMGDLLIVVNDDVAFETQGWERLLVAAAAEYPDGLFDLGVDTVMNNKNFVFPCQSRRQIETLGFFYDARLVYPDIWLRDVLSPFGRAVRADHVRIRHEWVGQTEDQQRAAAKVHGNAAYGRLYAQCVDEGRKKIAEVLTKVPS